MGRLGLRLVGRSGPFIANLFEFGLCADIKPSYQGYPCAISTARLLACSTDVLFEVIGCLGRHLGRDSQPQSVFSRNYCQICSANRTQRFTRSTTIWNTRSTRLNISRSASSFSSTIDC